MEIDIHFTHLSVQHICIRKQSKSTNECDRISDTSLNIPTAVLTHALRKVSVHWHCQNKENKHLRSCLSERHQNERQCSICLSTWAIKNPYSPIESNDYVFLLYLQNMGKCLGVRTIHRSGSSTFHFPDDCFPGICCPQTAFQKKQFWLCILWL